MYLYAARSIRSFAWCQAGPCGSLGTELVEELVNAAITTTPMATARRPTIHFAENVSLLRRLARKQKIPHATPHIQNKIAPSPDVRIRISSKTSQRSFHTFGRNINTSVPDRASVQTQTMPATRRMREQVRMLFSGPPSITRRIVPDVDDLSFIQVDVPWPVAPR